MPEEHPMSWHHSTMSNIWPSKGCIIHLASQHLLLITRMRYTRVYRRRSNNLVWTSPLILTCLLDRVTTYQCNWPTHPISICSHQTGPRQGNNSCNRATEWYKSALVEGWDKAEFIQIIRYDCKQQYSVHMNTMKTLADNSARVGYCTR